MTDERIFVATHTWRSSGYKLAKCKCGNQTTGIVKNIATGKKRPMCSTCAYAKGFR
jgi:hypothetical protein